MRPPPDWGSRSTDGGTRAARFGEVATEVLAAEGEWYPVVPYLPGFTSTGGTEAIVRTTIGERVLGPPPEPRLDRDVPFQEL